MTAAPKLLMTLWMMMLPTEMKLCCRMLGTAMTAKRPRWLHEKTATFPDVGIFANRRNTTTSASTQLTPWQRNVAHATPATPMSNSLGHSFSNHKLLLSVVFYIGFGIAVQTILSVVTAAGIRIDVDPNFWADPPAAVLLSYVIWGTAAWSVLECAAYYILTLLTLKKRLNLQ